MAAREDSQVKTLFEENQKMLIEEQNYNEYKEIRKNIEDSKKEGES